MMRGMAIEDSNSPHGLHLLIGDYPYAVDGLEILFAIKTWVENYCSFYYKSDHMVEIDTELQSWWTKIRIERHGDKKHGSWWPKMHTCHDLVDTCTTIIWVASALHAAVNFGQYTYDGYLLNRPSISCRFLPQPMTPEYEELQTDPERVMLKTFHLNPEMLLGMSLAKLLSTHPSTTFAGTGETNLCIICLSRTPYLIPSCILSASSTSDFHLPNSLSLVFWPETEAPSCARFQSTLTPPYVPLAAGLDNCILEQ